MDRAKHWFYRKSTEETEGQGPFDVNEMREHYKAGLLTETHEIRDHSFKWQTLGSHSLLGLLKAPPPKVAPKRKAPVEPEPEPPAEETRKADNPIEPAPRIRSKASERRRGDKDPRDKVTGEDWYNLRKHHKFTTIVFQLFLFHLLLIFSDVILVSNFTPVLVVISTVALLAGFFVLAIYAGWTLKT